MLTFIYDSVLVSTAAAAGHRQELHVQTTEESWRRPV